MLVRTGVASADRASPLRAGCGRPIGRCASPALARQSPRLAGEDRAELARLRLKLRREQQARLQAEAIAAQSIRDALLA